MQLTDLNRAHDIGSNSILAEIGPFRILVDCGLHPKKVALEALPDLKRLRSAPPDYIVITHSHLDHGGSLPVALRHAPGVPVLVTSATQMLLPRMLRNSYSVMKRQRDERRIAEYPLFTPSEIERVEHQMLALPHSIPRNLEKDGHKLELTLFHAGHVAGAAGLRLVHKDRRYFFTGDVLFADQTTLSGAQFPKEKFDVLVTETTRGAHKRARGASREKETARFIETLDKTLADGGSVLVPVFALGRMQEILALVHKARREGRLRETPVFASGLGLDLVDYFDTLSRQDTHIRFRRTILGDMGVKPLRHMPTPGRAPGQPSLFIVSSGMMVENTPSYMTAAALLGGPRNAVCFVGYCDPDTPGGRLQTTPREGDFTFDTLEYSTKVRANVDKFDLSGHADREELLAFARDSKPGAVVLTHGDPPAREWFAKALADVNPALCVTDPDPGEPWTTKGPLKE